MCGHPSFIFDPPLVQGAALTFTAESLDARHWYWAFIMTGTIIASTLCGLVLSLFSDRTMTWALVLLTSVAFFACLHVRLYYTQRWMHADILTELHKNSFTGRIVIQANNLRAMNVLLWTAMGLNYLMFWYMNVSNSKKVKGAPNEAEAAVTDEMCNASNVVWVLSLFRNPQFVDDLFFGFETVLDATSKICFIGVLWEQYALCLNHCSAVENRYKHLQAHLRSEFEIIMNSTTETEIIHKIHNKIMKACFLEKSDESSNYLGWPAEEPVAEEENPET